MTSHLVLGGGGTPGMAFHAGVFVALIELGVDPRAGSVVGTSAGAVSSLFVAADVPSGQIVERTTELIAEISQQVSVGPDPELRNTLLQDGIPVARPIRMLASGLGTVSVPAAFAASVLPGTHSSDVVADAARTIQPDWPDDLDLRVCTVRRRDGRRVVFGSDTGDVALHRAVSASCAIPGHFEPVDIDGDDHIDGCARSPTNATAVRFERGGIVCISAPMSLARPGRLAEHRRLGRWAKASVLVEAARLRAGGHRVIVIEPVTANLWTSDRSGPSQQAVDRATEQGYAQAHACFARRPVR